MDRLNQENKVVFFSQNIVYIVVTIDNDTYRHLNKIDKIEKDYFYNFSNNLVKNIGKWKEKYYVERINNNTNWSILVNTLNGVKRYAGIDYPDNWNEFYNQFKEFINKDRI